MDKLIKEGIQVKTAFIGEGDLRNSLINNTKVLKLENNIDFLGFVSNPYPYIKNAKLLILPSLSEGVSRAVLESLFLGTPIVLSDGEAGCELVENKKSGSLLVENDKDNWHQIVLKYLIGNKESKSLLPLEFRKKHVISELKKFL